ncbi:hypothetical protein H634G_10229 [Metarhizium anisopliae BRIP 53293]|uniref:Major facilitator superfamily (MFS) profile domain-containing protein n=1 Tax=Metarhizium anisopliae BRIP 53293 TaxID=1291518 RepID=A0A0D9NK54_METAN|nr:hypothetical protein H634G_10229 [Metarhizium anisopliae BRIP 53293]KJK87229.1 hypothetical protein H633G_08914 [Metarhizium anisopliae BRIP 53284]
MRIALFNTKTLRPRSSDKDGYDSIYLNSNGNVDFGPQDKDNPHNWSTLRRLGISACAGLLVMNATFASSAPSGCLTSISQEFDVSMEAASLTMTLFLLGYCAGPLLFAPLSEFYGRKWIFYICFTAYILFGFLCAFAPNFGSLLAGRFLTGTLVSAPLSNTPGLLADLWGPVERGSAMAGFSVIVSIGPALGPVVAGFLQLKKNWRWIFYVLLWLGAGTWALMLTIPETHGPTILTHKARHLRKAKIPGFESVKALAEEQRGSLKAVYKIALTRPWAILFDVISCLCAIYMSVVYALMFMLFSIYPIVFQQKRGWNAGVGQLPLLGIVIGSLVGGLVSIYFTRRRPKVFREATAPAEDVQPEERLPPAMVGGVGFAVTMFWLAWSAEYDSVHWIVPTLAGVFLQASLLLIFISFLNYLVDTYLAYAASAVAANTIARSAFASVAPLFTKKMFDTLGIGGGGSLIGGVATVLAVIPFMFYKYGREIRIRSRFAPTTEKREEGIINAGAVTRSDANAAPV